MRVAPSTSTDHAYPASKLLAALLILVPMALFLSYLAVEVGHEGAHFGAVLLALVACSLIWLYYRILKVHVQIEGRRFVARSLFGNEVVGEVGEFIGAESDEALQRWLLLRRDDLKVVTIPWFSNGGYSKEDQQVRRWVLANLAECTIRRVSAIKKGMALGKHQALHILRTPPEPSEPGGEFVAVDVDVRLSGAALSAASGYLLDARSDLERLVLELPRRALARQYVVQALRRLGDASSRTCLASALREPRAALFKEQIAEALAHLATVDDCPLLVELAHDPEPFIQNCGRVALDRVCPQTNARSETRAS